MLDALKLKKGFINKVNDNQSNGRSWKRLILLKKRKHEMLTFNSEGSLFFLATKRVFCSHNVLASIIHLDSWDFKLIFWAHILLHVLVALTKQSINEIPDKLNDQGVTFNSMIFHSNVTETVYILRKNKPHSYGC